MAKYLNTSVAVNNVWYRPGDRVGDQIPEDVAEKITNKRVWSYDDGEEPEVEQPKSTTGAKLASRVAIDGQWYGPGDDVPDDVAKKITNPRVWEGGKAPSFDTDTTPAAKADDEVEQPVDEPAAQADNAEPSDADGDRRPARRGRRA